MMLWKCCTHYASKFGKLDSGHRTGKGQFSFQSQRKQFQRMLRLPHNCIISHATKVMLKILQPRLQQYMNCELPDVQARFRKGKGSEIKLPPSVESSKKEDSSRKTSISALLNMPKPLMCGSQQTVENSERDGNTRPPDLPFEKPICRSGSNS